MAPESGAAFRYARKMDFERLRDDLQLYGDRSSQFMTSYPGFTEFAAPLPGQLRYLEAGSLWIAANEPIAPTGRRADWFEEFAVQAAREKRAALMMPAGEALARELSARGFHVCPIGAEPVFDLEAYFFGEREAGLDPLDLFPSARTWLRRGARVRAVAGAALTEADRARIAELTEAWKREKGGKLGFLNQVDPLRHAGEKRYYLLEQGGQVAAFLAVAPVPQRAAYFAADYVRDTGTRAGAIECLFIEAMRQMRATGVRELRWGLCPLAQLPVESNAPNRLLRFAFARLRRPYSFKTIYDFKRKLDPTRWEPAYLVSSRPITVSLLARVAIALGARTETSPSGKRGGWALGWWNLLRPEAQAALAPARRAPLTIALAALCLLLHLAVARGGLPAGYTAANFTWTGWFIGPLFHTTNFHLAGDLLSLVFFGALFESAFGLRRVAPVIALGLWASNPVTVALVSPVLRALSPEAVFQMWREVDYGSSNAVYALVGAWAATLTRARLLLLPFLANAALVCWDKGSWLALHHGVALAMGWIYVRAWLERERS